MAKTRTLSRKFLKGHPREGQETFFVEQVLNALLDLKIYTNFDSLVKLNQDKIDDPKSNLVHEHIIYLWESLDKRGMHGQKFHTIRGGHHFKQGDKIQLAVWSGKPYQSPQIKICPELEVKAVYDFEICQNPVKSGPVNLIMINNFDCDLDLVAQNDGLLVQDFLDWFKYPSEFDGQIICWKDPKY